LRQSAPRRGYKTMNRPFQNLESTGPLLFDGLVAVCWFVHMNSSITSPRVTNISPGQLYTFVFTQDATGGHRMVWPANCINANPINPTPNATTVQNFIGNLGGLLYSNVPSTGKKP
jgi:hypothetical protein